MEAYNVANLSQDSLYETVMTFLQSRNHNTRKGYKKDLEYFFSIMRNKSFGQLIKSDIIISLNDVERFRLHLKNKGEANTTINRRVSALRKFIKYLAANNYNVNVSIFSEVKDLPQRPKSYGIPSPDEAFQLAEAARTERFNGEKKYLFIMTAIYTSIRLDALTNISWENIKKESEDTYIIETYDKNNELIQRSIHADFYKDLLKIKQPNESRVFKFDSTGVSKMMERLCEKVGIPKERNITFHSLRKVGINHVWDTTGDFEATLAQSGHKNIQVLYNSYIKKKKDFSQMAGILMTKSLDEDSLKLLSHNELLNVISRSTYTTKSEIINKAKEMYGGS